MLAVISMAGYFLYFGFVVDLKLSKNPEHWTWASDFFTGIFGSVLSFVSVIFLIYTLGLQNRANQILEKEVSEGRKQRKIEQFETQFFNLIEAQRQAFNDFSLEFFDDEQGQFVVYKSNLAVNITEDFFEELTTASQKKELIDRADEEESIYRSVRSFFVITKVIERHLSDEKGFSKELRQDYYETLINFTEFSLLRIILIGTKYTDANASKQLSENKVFLNVLKKLGYLEYFNDI